MIGPLTWQLFGILCRAYKKFFFFIFRVDLAFLTHSVLHANKIPDVNHSIFITVMGSVESWLWRDDLGAPLLL